MLHVLLSGANFVQGMGAFCVIALLPDIALGLHIPAHEAGWLVSCYAAVYALSSPVLLAIFGTGDRRSFVIWGLVLLAVGAFGVSLATGLPSVLLARALMAVGGGLITPVVASLAVATSAPQARGRALSFVFAGLPLAQAVGMPLGNWVSAAFSWRYLFIGIGIAALLTALALRRLAPRGIRVQPVSLKSLVEAISEPRSLLAVSFIVAYVGSNFALLTYLAPFFAERLHLATRDMTAVFALYGIAAFIGNVIGGLLTDRLGPPATLLVLCLATSMVLPATTYLDLGPAVGMVMLAVWAACSWAVHSAQQARLSRLDPPRAPMLLALHSSALYLGSWVGATLGGSVLAGAGVQWLGPAGSVLTIVALGTLLVSDRWKPAAAQGSAK